MNKEQKKNYISKMETQFQNNEAILVTHYQGLTMTQLDELRSQMREHGIKFQITKNRITKLAIEKTKCKDLSNLFSGATAVAFSNDAIITARILSKFAKDNENLKLLGGIMGEEVLDQAGVQNVANLPTLDEARAKIVGILATPASKFVSILLARSEKMGNLSPENSEKTTQEV
ncbi:50S ribosomal protein L10 [Candidatus Pelagibacter bacterium]|nr:50S ribosomal protein L10 [Candidatus Pelagibacter bacterium]